MSKKENFQSLVDQLSAEFEENEGRITCEFSTDKLNLAEKLEYIGKKQVKDGHWTLYWCETCFNQHPEFPFHVSIHTTL